MTAGDKKDERNDQSMTEPLSRRGENRNRIGQVVHGTSRRWRPVLGVILALALGAACLPYLIAVSPLRNLLLNRLVRPAHIHVSAQSLHLGWLSPLALGGVEAVSDRGSRLLSVDRIEAGRSWWRLLLARPDIGRVKVIRPQVELVYDGGETNFSGLGGNPAGPPQPLSATLHVQDASLEVRQGSDPRPTVYLEGLDAMVQVIAVNGEDVLTVDQISSLERAELTPEMCRRGLQLIAPALSESTEVQGQVSLAVEKLLVPLAGPQRAEGSGRLVLHSVEAMPRSPWLAQVLGILQAALGANAPTRIRLADEAQVLFRLEDGRIHHEGMEFGLPELSRELLIRTSGSVGLDESLDLIVELPRIRTLLRELVGGTSDSEPAPVNPSELAPLRLRVIGNLQRPELELAEGQGAVVELLQGLIMPRGPGGTSVLDDMLDGLQRRMEMRRQRAREQRERAEENRSDVESRRPLRRRLRRQNP
jgi:hypothetical protein